MNTLTPLKQQLEPRSYLIEAHEMTLKAQPLNNEFIKQISNIFFQAGRAFESVESQRQVLEAGNLALEHDIQEIKEAHLKDLNDVVDAWEAKAIAIVQKLTIIVERIRIYSSTPKYCGAYPIDTAPLQALIDSVPALDYETLRKYPEIQITQDMPQEDMVLGTLEEFLFQTHPLIQGLMESRKQEIEELTKEIKLLKAAQFVLIHKKKSIVEFYEKHMKKMNDKMEEKLGLNKIREKAHTLLSNIKWDIPKTSHTGCSNCCIRRGIASYARTELFHGQIQEIQIKDLKNLYEWVESIWSSISTKKIKEV